MDQASFDFCKRLSSRLITCAVTAASQFLVPGNPRRIALTFPSPLTNRYSYSPNVDSTDGSVFTMVAGHNPVEFCVFHHGDAVRGRWSLISPVADQTVFVLETEYLESKEPPTTRPPTPAEVYRAGVEAMAPPALPRR